MSTCREQTRTALLHLNSITSIQAIQMHNVFDYQMSFQRKQLISVISLDMTCFTQIIMPFYSHINITLVTQKEPISDLTAQSGY